MATAWYAYHITQAYGQNGEAGVDLGTPFHTPITALFGGTVRFAGRTQWRAGGSSGGEVTIVTNLPGLGPMTSYYLHLDTADVKVGQVVQPGQRIGLSGGQLSGGQWPVRNIGGMFSNGPHTEFGFNASWVSGPGHHIDPTRYILQARAGTLPHVAGDGTSSTVTTPASGGTPTTATPASPTLTEAVVLSFYGVQHQTKKVISQPEGIEGICKALDYAEEFPDWNWMNPFGSVTARLMPWSVRAIFGGLAGAIMLVVLWAWVRGPLRLALDGASTAGVPGVRLVGNLVGGQPQQQTPDQQPLPDGVQAAPVTVAK